MGFPKYLIVDTCLTGWVLTKPGEGERRWLSNESHIKSKNIVGSSLDAKSFRFNSSPASIVSLKLSSIANYILLVGEVK
eukprot:m.32215 g.32215  ORF g.32215 m.32215 type:complete len:79 (+) comp8386_c0_seq1:1292-1528(+)